MPYEATVGLCYERSDGTYLGKYEGMKSARSIVHDAEAGEAGQYRAPLYVFEKANIKDDYFTSGIIKEVPCKTGARRRKSKSKTKKAGRRTRKKRV